VAPAPNIETAVPVLVSEQVEIADRREDGAERGEGRSRRKKKITLPGR